MKIRADAARNTERVLRAASRCFAEHGANVPLEEVAKTAGLGVATVHRRFGGRTRLASTVFVHALRDLNASIAVIAEFPEPAGALRLCLQELFERRAADRSLIDAIAGTDVSDIALERERAHLKAQLNHVVDRAASEGKLRNELESDDILPLALMVGTVADSPRLTGATSWRRYANLILDAFFDEDPVSPGQAHAKRP
ncbi:hypothetical protein BJK06_04850 [Curtobacterium sp. BH-2-1-1]|nr:hypothetical protein BJK06_04850 [Curtobacterium sp. BH-2-1-1]